MVDLRTRQHLHTTSASVKLCSTGNWRASRRCLPINLIRHVSCTSRDTSVGCRRDFVVKREGQEVAGCVSHVAVIISNSEAYRPNRASRAWSGTTSPHATSSTKMEKLSDTAGRSVSPVRSLELVATLVRIAKQEGTCTVLPGAGELPQRARGRLLQRRWLCWRKGWRTGSISKPLLDDMRCYS
jgi:hypothetical protein